MYAYKCGEYERCLMLCQQNVYQLFGRSYMKPTFHLPFSDLLLLLDDDCLALIGIAVLGGVPDSHPHNSVNQLTMSLYLAVQCQLKTGCSPMFVLVTLRTVVDVYSRCADYDVSNRLLLTFIYRKAIDKVRQRRSACTTRPTVP